MSGEEANLFSHLQSTLRTLCANPYPVLDSPPTTKKRASVALILRVQPSYYHWPAEDAPVPTSAEGYFAQEWVQYGEPEVLFIKRADRKGDRWTSHVALPGGRRDPEDVDDQAAAVREAWEEVGIDLKEHSIEVGNLPQRLVTTHWGKKPLMVLCPYIFLITTFNLPPLRLQPTEVASTHWVPLRSLLSPTQRAVAFEDVSSRTANQETGVKTWMLSVIFGKMLFAAIQLEPSETLKSHETPVPNQRTSGDIIAESFRPSWVKRLAAFEKSLLSPTASSLSHQPPLLLWGLTLGVMADFLDLLPPHTALELWTYPTFTPWDVKFSIWALTYRFKHRKRAELQAGTQLPDEASRPSQERDIAAKYVAVETLPGDGATGQTTPVLGSERPAETGLHGLGTGVESGGLRRKKSAVATMLEGYYDIMRRAVAVALFGRASMMIVLLVMAWRRWRKR